MFRNYENECAEIPEDMLERIFVLDADGKSVPLEIPDDTEETHDA